jgi:hypothetical protein
MVYSPLSHTIQSVDQLNESNGRIYKQYVNSKTDAPLPPNGLHAYVDVGVCSAPLGPGSFPRSYICTL